MSRPVARGTTTVRVQDLVDTIVYVLREDDREGLAGRGYRPREELAEDVVYRLLEGRPRPRE
jgi:hypothetical protein